MKILIFLMSPFFLFSQTQIGNDIDGEAAGDHSGYVSISNDGTIVAIGGPGYENSDTYAGHVRVFENISGVWMQLGETISGELEGDRFGSSVSLSGDGSILAIGGPYNDGNGIDTGHVRVFENISGVWEQIGDDIYGVDIEDSFGRYVSLSNDGSKLAISGYRCCGMQHGFPDVGDTRIYENISGIWTQIGGVINTGFRGISDVELSADGSVVAIASPGGGMFLWSNFYVSGVEVYENISGVWTQLGDAIVGESPDGIVYNFFGGVSLANNDSITAIAIGGVLATRVYKISNADEWGQLGVDIETGFFRPGISLSNNANILIIGGSITRVYESNSGNWTQLGVDINGETSNDRFGSSLELSNDDSTLVVGAPQNDGNGEDSGHARVYSLSDLLSVDTSNKITTIIYPNPAQDVLNIESQQPIQSIKIYNLQGQLIMEDSSNNVDVSQLNKGLYFVQVNVDGQSLTKKFIKE